jgi:hypothetical protein
LIAEPLLEPELVADALDMHLDHRQGRAVAAGQQAADLVQREAELA